MEQQTTTVLIFLMAMVTALPRLLPIIFLADRPLSGPFATWLRYVPVAVIAAMLGPALFTYDGRFNVSLENSYLLVALPTAFVAWKTRNLATTILIGVLLLALLRGSS